MALAETALARRARRSYELGRVRRGAAVAAVSLPITALALACGNAAAGCVAAGLVLAGIVGAALWRGAGYDRGVWPGLLGGVPALLLPLLGRGHGRVCAASFCMLLPAVCIVAGLIAGVVVAAAARGTGAPARTTLVAAFAVAAVCGAMGCLTAGLAGLVGMALGLGVIAAPKLAWSKA